MCWEVNAAAVFRGDEGLEIGSGICWERGNTSCDIVALLCGELSINTGAIVGAAQSVPLDALISSTIAP